MAQIFSGLSQSISEVKTHTIDFLTVLPTGGTVTAGTATHTPPGGGTATAVTCSVTSPYVFVTVGPLNILGTNYIDVQATFNNGDKSTARIVIDTFYPAVAARSGMVDILAELRGMTETNANDYTISNQVFWTDKQLQDILDRHALEIEYEPMILVPSRKAGGYSYTDYYVNHKWLEQDATGIGAFKIQDINGGTVSAALYSVDYALGEVTFITDQGSTIPYYVTCISYDINAAAAEVWHKKSGHYASAYDFSTDNHSMKRSQLMVQAQQMASYYLGLSNEGALNIPLGRSDDTNW